MQYYQTHYLKNRIKITRLDGVYFLAKDFRKAAGFCPVHPARVKSGFENAMLPANLLDRNARFLLFEDRNDGTDHPAAPL
ncbi:hypothetical protein [Dyadobacter beijingensis]|uniref:hypothetical protein n=1 Tax=Dyadobacter beijingensis TaxID=365489 RepID=UPI0012F77245|nr:hypothetical protein [Dyadobacter beijingensis]